jgi:hypothetical protein
MLHHTRPRTSRAPTIVVLIALLAALLFAASPAQADPPDDYAGAAFQLTILHNNDGESRLINAGVGREEYGGAARFKALVDTQRAAAANSLMISSGDNFLAGPEFNFGLVHRADTGEPMFDTIAMGLIGYDAVNLGNHDFDFGPDVLADFIVGYQTPPTLPAPYLGTWTVPPYVSANLDFSGEPSLAALVDPLGTDHDERRSDEAFGEEHGGDRGRRVDRHHRTADDEPGVHLEPAQCRDRLGHRQRRQGPGRSVVGGAVQRGQDHPHEPPPEHRPRDATRFAGDRP